MYDCTFPVNGNYGKTISLVTGRVAFEPFGSGLWPFSIERLNFIGSPGHSTKTVTVDGLMSIQGSNFIGSQGYSTKGGFLVMAEITRILAANIRRHFFL